MSETEAKSEEALLDEVRGQVRNAARILKTLGPDKSRIGWLLEDTLTYLDEIGADDTFKEFDSKQTESSIEKLNRIANMGS